MADWTSPDGAIRLIRGDCLQVLPALEAESVDAVVTDPPYGLGFMGANWDHGVPGVPFWREALRVAKPGAHLLAFGGTRTFHRLACAIEDAGWEIRDTIMWVYGSGFPKSLDVSKAIDRMDASEEQERRRLRFTAWVRSTGVTSRQIDEATGTNMGGHYTTAASQPAIMTREHLEACRHLLGDVPEWVEREVVGFQKRGNAVNTDFMSGGNNITAPATDAARQWQGWGTALKPAHEDIIWATKPLTPHRERDIIVENLTKLEARLWSLLPVSVAEKRFGLSPSEFDAVCGSAQWSADERSSIRDALCEAMDTSQFVSAIASSLNTVSSWRSIFGGSYEPESMFTIETGTRQTIGWKTLKCCSSDLMPQSIIEAATRQPGSWWSALPAARALNAAALSIDSTRELSVAASAISTGDGEGLRPNCEPIIVARKPLDGTVAENVLRHGTGALNIDGCRVGTEDNLGGGAYAKNPTPRDQMWGDDPGNSWRRGGAGEHQQPSGRWPANLIHDGSDEVVGMFPVTNGKYGMTQHGSGTNTKYGKFNRSEQSLVNDGVSDSGSAARFFYCAKASRADRDEGCEGLEARRTTFAAGTGLKSDGDGSPRNHHPTVKPTALMRYLCRLVTPPGGVVLDPFMGSGSTGKAAVLEGFRFLGIEIDIDKGYFEIAKRRVEAELERHPLLDSRKPGDIRESGGGPVSNQESVFTRDDKKSQKGGSG